VSVKPAISCACSWVACRPPWSKLTPPLVGQLYRWSGKCWTTLLGNLETLSTNAATASANLRDISTALNSPTNVLVLQQTLDSARATFENAQKITADLDELTGDPAFRNNVKQLVNGLGNLVSSTEQLQQQVQVWLRL
jgi:hypothetical protein